MRDDIDDNYHDSGSSSGFLIVLNCCFRSADSSKILLGIKMYTFLNTLP